tara:strand:+ start:103224 stop:103601 length:378 start_codon:yes stop_codon:yes gene_type:complete
MAERKKAGKKPMGERALTGVEKNRRFLNRRRLLNEAAREARHTPVTVLIDDMQLDALKELEKSWGNSLSGAKLDVLLFMAIKSFLESDTFGHLKTPKKKNWPQATIAEVIHIKAHVKFAQWEKQQ